MKINWQDIHKTVGPWAITGLLFVFYTFLFFVGKFGVKSYIFIICFNTFFLLALLGFPRLRELDIRNLKLVLDKIKKEKEEIFATEKQLKEMAMYVAEVLAFLSLVEGRMRSKEFHKLKTEWVRAKLRDLKIRIGIDLKNIDVYEQIYSEIDALVEEASNITNPKYAESKKTIEKLSQRLTEQMKKDIESAKS